MFIERSIIQNMNVPLWQCWGSCSALLSFCVGCLCNNDGKKHSVLRDINKTYKMFLVF